MKIKNASNPLILLFLFLFSLSFSQNVSTDTNINSTNPEENNPNLTNQYVQEQQNPSQPLNPNFGIGVQFGAMTINETNYNSIRFQPEFSIGKFGIGLDINFEFDADGNFLITEWNTWQAILSKILYIRYGFKGEPVFIRVGGINDFSLGNGFIINRYSNMLAYPAIKKIGVAFDLDLQSFGFESMADNIFDFDILGLRAYYRPLLGTDLPIIKNLEIGATIADDLDPQNPSPPADRPYDFKDSTNSTNVFVYGVDLGLPIINSKAIIMKTYFDYASIVGKGTGESLGLSGKIISIIPYQLELRLLQPKFTPYYFDLYYDADRSTKYDSMDLITNSYIGWLFSTGLSIFDDKLYWLCRVENNFAEDSKPMLTFTFGLSKDLLKRLSIELIWSRKNITYFSDLFYIDVNSILIATIDYYVTDNLALSINYKRTFQVDPNGQIQPFDSTIVSTKINF